MKGVVLCGGLGTRLKPLTDVLNKHLLPIHDKPMCFYPLQMLADAGIKDVMLVVGGKSTGDFLKLLKDGSRFGLRSLYYAYQEGEGGIAHALSLAEAFVGNDNCCVVLGDNILGESLGPYVEAFLRRDLGRPNAKLFSMIESGAGAHVLLKLVPNPKSYGVPTFLGMAIKYITEKPKDPDSMYAVIGVYMYDQTVFEKIRTLKPSERRELEITDVNNLYALEGRLSYSFVSSWWMDAGSSIQALKSAGSKIEFEGRKEHSEDEVKEHVET